MLRGCVCLRRVLRAMSDHSLQIPEKLSPYKYDIFGSSHQILHVAVVLAGLAHMLGLFRAFQFHHTQGSLCR